MDNSKLAGPGDEAYYPKKWNRLAYVMAGLLVVSLAECFRQETAVRIGAALAVLVFGGISFFSFRNLFLVTTGQAYLKLSRQGISFRYGKIASSFAWADIKDFGAIQIQDGKLLMVGIAFNDTARLTEGEKGDRKTALQMTQGRFDGILLPDAYSWKAKELAPYLNSMKERYASVTRINIYEK